MSRNPYHREDGGPKLRRSVLVLMDILGYREMASSAEEEDGQQKFLESLHESLVTGRQWIEEKPSEDIEKIREKDFSALKAFTDNIVIGFPISGDGEIELGQAFDQVGSFQLTMALRGFFVRGAISIGDAYVDDIAVVGRAFDEAYAGESSIARDPRVVLTRSAIDAVNSHLNYYGRKPHAPQVRELLEDVDGQWFVNYLEQVLILADIHGPFYRELLRHKAVVEQKLTQFIGQPNVFSKYAWVANYHNAFCKLHPNYFSEKHMIQTELFYAPPKPILE